MGSDRFGEVVEDCRGPDPIASGRTPSLVVLGQAPPKVPLTSVFESRRVKAGTIFYDQGGEAIAMNG
jgi:hypothetical protein